MHTICHLKLIDMINNLEIFRNWEPEAPVNIRWRGFASLQQFHRRYNPALQAQQWFTAERRKL
ncbi:hypothetical protein ACVXHA_15750 [Escherichia coli]